MKRWLIVAIIALFVALWIGHSNASADVTFNSPSKNIHCKVFSIAVRCMTMNNFKSASVYRSGKVTTGFLPLGVPPYPLGHTLPYGQWMKAPALGVKCTSLHTGMRCEAKGHGFLLAREGTRTW